MAPTTGIVAIAWALLATLAVAQQQAILQVGSLPACAQSCQLLIQASQACSGTASASQSAWVCFCQSAYLTALRQSASTICSAECTSQSDLSAVSTWYNTQCGSDNGQSEHQGDGDAAATTPVDGATNAQATSTNPSATNAASNSGDSNDATNSTSNAPSGDWWSNHYQWIIMILVLAILLPAVGVLGHWLKRRHDRKRDLNTTGFNAGITSRTGPMGNPDHNMSGAVGSPNLAGSRGDSPARTRDAFMPYGYGYSRSESGFDSRQETHADGASPAPRDRTPDPEKRSGRPNTQTSKRLSKRVLVREHSGADSVVEKGSRF